MRLGDPQFLFSRISTRAALLGCPPAPTGHLCQKVRGAGDRTPGDGILSRVQPKEPILATCLGSMGICVAELPASQWMLPAFDGPSLLGSGTLLITRLGVGNVTPTWASLGKKHLERASPHPEDHIVSSICLRVCSL